MFAVAWIGVGIATQYHARTKAEVVVILAIPVLAAGIVASRAVAASTRCPNCGTMLGRAGASLMTKKPADRYPACGMQFDEPMPTMGIGWK